MSWRSVPAIGGGGGGGGGYDPNEWAQRNSMLYLPVGANQTGQTVLACSVDNFGNLTAQTVNPAAGTLFESLKRLGHRTNTGVNNRSACFATAGPQYFRGNAAGLGGFRAVLRWGVSQQNAGDMRIMCGMTSGTSVPAGSVEPSANTNCFFVGADSTDTQLQLMHNDAAGACTKVALGVGMPWLGVANVDLYQVVLTCAVGVVTEMSYTVTRLDTGTEVSGTINSNLPTVNVLLKPTYWISNGPTNAAQTTIDELGWYVDDQNGVVP
ncbi:MAG: hypothetical protein JSV86_06465 [Gemmatimonadota bacterium]|nr:MAG: hypothetical protein JSV86_06465 [Gemmatimonadota bacterium]